MFKVNLGGCHLISDAVINEVRLEFIHNGALSTCTIPHFLFAAHRGKVTRQWKIWVKFAISASNRIEFIYPLNQKNLLNFVITNCSPF